MPPRTRMPDFAKTTAPKPRLALLALAAAILLSLLIAPAANAAQPCWRQLVDDYWADNRVDKIYPLHCYREAMAKLPRDVQEYSDVQDDLRRALLTAIRDERSAGGYVGGDGNGAGVPEDEDGDTTAAPPPVPGEDEGGPSGFFGEVLAKLGPSNADSIPVPLLVLGAIALLLVGAAGVSYAARYVQARRVGVAPHGPPDDAA